jgi:hypothetical protein
MLGRGERRDLRDFDLTGDHVMAEPDHHLSEQLEPIAPFVRDQNAQMLNVAMVCGRRHGEADSTAAGTTLVKGVRSAYPSGSPDVS